MRTPSAVLAASVAFLTVAPASTGFAQSVNVIAAQRPYTSTRASRVSANGMFASVNSNAASRAAGGLWDRETGLAQPVSGSPFDRFSQAWAVADNGTIAGINGPSYAPNGPTFGRAYTYSREGVYREIPVERFGNFRISHATAISADGSVVAGRFTDAGGGATGVAFVWYSDGTVLNLGRGAPDDIGAEVKGISRDGSVVAGYSHGEFSHAWVWTNDTGMQFLSGIDGIFGQESVWGLSANGRYVCGDASGRPCVWDNGELRLLSELPAFMVGIADDGSIAAGHRYGVIDHTAAVWTPATDVIGLGAYLDIMSIPYDPRWVFQEVTGISADGKTISGWGRIDGIGYGFVITIPTPAPFIAISLVLFSRRRSRRS